MKFENSPRVVVQAASHPARGAWIEIKRVANFPYKELRSHPARGAWIEIDKMQAVCVSVHVAPRKGCVD